MNRVPFEAEVPQGKLILSRTDLKGKITFVNDTFAQVSGYDADELIGEPHNIVRHPDMPRSIFKQMWDTIQKGEEWDGVVKNLRKDGGYYWINANIAPLSENGKVVGYKSTRSYIPPSKRQEMEKKYALISKAEGGDVSVSLHLSKDQWKKLSSHAESKGITYQEAIKRLIGTL